MLQQPVSTFESEEDLVKLLKQDYPKFGSKETHGKIKVYKKESIDSGSTFDHESYRHHLITFRDEAYKAFKRDPKDSLKGLSTLEHSGFILGNTLSYFDVIDSTQTFLEK